MVYLLVPFTGTKRGALKYSSGLVKFEKVILKSQKATFPTQKRTIFHTVLDQRHDKFQCY